MRACVLVAALVGGASVAHADSLRIGFANGARSAKGAQTIIESLRMGASNEGFAPLAPGQLRSALEDPFEPVEPPSLDDAVAHLQKAKDSYASFEYGPALARLDEADEILRRLPASAELISVVADRYLLAGLVFAGRGARAQAAEAFRVVQRLDPSRTTLDAGVYRPAIVKMYERALAAATESVKIRIETEPPGAEVWVDGALAGEAPLTLKVARGLHRFAAQAGGHDPVARVIDVTSGAEPIELALRKPGVQAQIHQIRHALATGSTDDSAWKRGGGRLAALSGVDVMVLVRNAGEGVFEAAIYRAETSELGRWLPVPSSRFYEAIKPRSEQTAGNRDAATVPAAALSGSIDTGEDDDSWYSTWWGRSLIVGGAALAIGGVVFAVTRDSGSSSVGIGDWCFGMECQR